MLKILTHVIYTANRKRKKLTTPEVPYRYKRVTDVDTPVTEYLFLINTKRIIKKVMTD